MTNESENIFDVYAEDNTFLGSVAWRPHRKELEPYGGLFICG